MVNTDIGEIITKALQLVNDGTPVSTALLKSCPLDKKDRIDILFAQALSLMPVQGAPKFHLAILHQMLKISGSPKIFTKTKKDTIMQITPTKTKAKTKKKKFNEGDTFNVVANLGLQPTNPDKGTQLISYQFSRKTLRDGIMDVPRQTSVVFTGYGEVYEGNAKSKRMIFKVSAGTAMLDGEILDSDVLVAGVDNHVDDTSEYNIQSQIASARREEKRIEREALTLAADAVKAAAAGDITSESAEPSLEQLAEIEAA
jgi:hypothetical protein